MSHEIQNVSENAGDFLNVLCIAANIVAISTWLSASHGGSHGVAS